MIHTNETDSGQSPEGGSFVLSVSIQCGPPYTNENYVMTLCHFKEKFPPLPTTYSGKGPLWWFAGPIIS